MASEDRAHDLRIMRPMRCQLRYCHLSWGHKQHVQGLVGGQNLAYGMKGRGSNSQGRNNGKGSKVKYSRWDSSPQSPPWGGASSIRPHEHSVRPAFHSLSQSLPRGLPRPSAASALLLAIASKPVLKLASRQEGKARGSEQKAWMMAVDA